MKQPSSQKSSFQCVNPARYVTFVLLSSALLSGSCVTAQDDFFIVPAIVVPLMFVFFFGFVGMIICIICCIIFANRNANRTTFNARERPAQQVIYQGQATSAGGVTQPYPAQSNYPQSYPAPPQTYPVPSQLAYSSVPEPQQVSLPEATLHQGDAPPGYAEAVVMTTVAVDGQQTVASELPSKY